MGRFMIVKSFRLFFAKGWATGQYYHIINKDKEIMATIAKAIILNENNKNNKTVRIFTH